MVIQQAFGFKVRCWVIHNLLIMFEFDPSINFVSSEKRVKCGRYDVLNRRGQHFLTDDDSFQHGNKSK